MAKRYGLEEYKALGKTRDLEYVGSDHTPLATTPTQWKCIHCGTVMKKSFRAVTNTEKGCLCQSTITLQPDKYKDIAQRWHLIWEPGPLRPRNTKAQTYWRLPDGQILVASYYELAYEGKMPNRVKKALGLPYRKRGGPVNV